MNPDPASLDNLRDIALPPSVPWRPPAPGWWIAFALLAVVIVVVVFRVSRVWRRNAYRRAALRELQKATCVTEIAEILKRTALCGYPRTDVAALSGSDWCQWLGETAGGQMPDKVAEALTRGVFDKVETANAGEVTAFATDWINRHGNRTEDCRGSKET